MPKDLLIELIMKELQREDISPEQRERYINAVATHESRKLKLQCERVKGAKLTPAKKYTPKAVREAVIAEHNERLEAERQEKPLGQRVTQFLEELQKSSGADAPTNVEGKEQLNGTGG